MNIQQYDKNLKDMTTSFFKENRGVKGAEDILHVLVDNIAKVVYCCLSKEAQLHPKDPAYDFAKVIEDQIIEVATKANMMKELEQKLGFKIMGAE